ncbi:hypothetical protein C8R44DRAFT_727602 [Mycena epipterygia]|nr:hypothetical protein C8R44DRAFT_727602 [Mycena epipterygia]
MGRKASCPSPAPDIAPVNRRWINSWDQGAVGGRMKGRVKRLLEKGKTIVIAALVSLNPLLQWRQHTPPLALATDGPEPTPLFCDRTPLQDKKRELNNRPPVNETSTRGACVRVGTACNPNFASTVARTPWTGRRNDRETATYGTSLVAQIPGQGSV